MRMGWMGRASLASSSASAAIAARLASCSRVSHSCRARAARSRAGPPAMGPATAVGPASSVPSPAKNAANPPAADPASGQCVASWPGESATCTTWAAWPAAPNWP